MAQKERRKVVNIKDARRKKSAFNVGLFLATFITVTAVGIMLPEKQMMQLYDLATQAKNMAVDLAVANGLSTCSIKGNVSINSGEKIYHVPGQKYYRETNIRTEYGERWFCTEADASAAGWRKSRQ